MGGETKKGKTDHALGRVTRGRQMKTMRPGNGNEYQQPQVSLPLPHPPSLNILTSFILSPSNLPSKKCLLITKY